MGSPIKNKDLKLTDSDTRGPWAQVSHGVTLGGWTWTGPPLPNCLGYILEGFYSGKRLE